MKYLGIILIIQAATMWGIAMMGKEGFEFIKFIASGLWVGVSLGTGIAILVNL